MDTNQYPIHSFSGGQTNFPRRSYRQPGFSVIELVVVLAILGVLIAIGVGVFNTRNFGVTQAAQILSADVARARLEALKRNVLVGLRFNFTSGGGQYQVAFDSNDDGTLDNTDTAISTVVFGQNELGGVKGEFRQCTSADAAAVTTATIVFDPRGIYQLATSRTVQLSNGAGFKRFVNINQQGRAQITTTCP